MIDKYDKIFVSFSGGQTSAYMALWIRDKYPDKKLKFVFANTGQEHEETYKFINNIESYYGLSVTWIESVIPEKGAKSYKIVNYDTACRDGSLFEAMIKRFGIPNQGFQHCTRELKTVPMYYYINELWPKKDYITAIGIRSDEIDRVSKNYKENRYWYPLAWNGVTKEIVNNFWDDQPFKLGIPNYLGNCVWCWKKSFSKHYKILEDNPEFYTVPDELEKKYGVCNIQSQRKRLGQYQPFFRKNKSVADLRNDLSELIRQDEEDGYENSCKESCEPM